MVPVSFLKIIRPRNQIVHVSSDLLYDKGRRMSLWKTFIILLVLVSTKLGYMYLIHRCSNFMSCIRILVATVKRDVSNATVKGTPEILRTASVGTCHRG